MFISCVNHTFTLEDWITLKLYLINFIQVKEQNYLRSGTIIWSILFFSSYFLLFSSDKVIQSLTLVKVCITFWFSPFIWYNQKKMSPKINQVLISRVIYFLLISGVKFMLINIWQQLVVSNFTRIIQLIFKSLPPKYQCLHTNI